MKNHQIHIDIEGLKREDHRAQEQCYRALAPMLKGICYRYSGDINKAEDWMHDSFIKIFKKINTLKDDKLFFGWVKRIAINTCLMHLRKNHFHVALEDAQITEVEYPKGTNTLSTQEIKSCILLLPEGYRTVFNMYVIDGLKHREIAEKLNISLNTSKSQLIMARKRLKLIIEEKLGINKDNVKERYR